MKKLLLAAAAAIVVLTGCSSTEAPNFQDSATVQTPASRDESGYLNALHTIEPGFSSISDAELIMAGDGVCTILDEVGPEGLYDSVVENNMDTKQAGYIAGAAVRFLCQEHIGAVEEWLANN